MEPDGGAENNLSLKKQRHQQTPFSPFSDYAERSTVLVSLPSNPVTVPIGPQDGKGDERWELKEALRLREACVWDTMETDSQNRTNIT